MSLITLSTNIYNRPPKTILLVATIILKLSEFVNGQTDDDNVCVRFQTQIQKKKYLSHIEFLGN